ncbi:MAG: right-handed parallel beta-helix repeat-containing protein [Nitrososphaerota archaeon]|nr:right-handed parallel beta-helix repeat-containing protein [Nitrososphaerota archaeon]
MNVKKSKSNPPNLHKNLSNVVLLSILLFSVLLACTLITHAQTPQTNNTTYVGTEAELRTAIDNAKTNTATTITLKNNIKLNNTLTIPVEKSITLTSNSNEDGFFKLIGASGLSALAVENHGVLELAGIIVTHDKDTCGRGVTVAAGGTLILTKGSISNNTATSENGAGVHNLGNFTMIGGDISQNHIESIYDYDNDINCGSGGGVYNAGVFSLFGGVISDNSVNTEGGGVCNYGYLRISGGEISNNSAWFAGGEISNSNTLYVGGGIANTGSCTISGGAIINNKAIHGGGGIYNNYGGVFVVSNCILTNNTASTGGGIHNYGSFTASNCTLTNNTVTWGGGIFNTGADCVVSNCTIANNTAQSGGGGIFNPGEGFVVSNCTLTNNKAAYQGGGICTSGDSLVTDCIIANNIGGGIEYFGGWGFVVSNCTITNNIGNGIHNSGGTGVVVTNCTITHNTATEGGGINNGGDNRYTYGANFTVSNCVITNNCVTQAGGGIYNNGANFTLSNCTLTNNTAQSGGGGIHNSGWGFVVSNSLVTSNGVTGLGGYGYGGGIYNAGNEFTLLNCTLTGNSVQYMSGKDGFGGSIYNIGTGFTISNCIITNNAAQSNWLGYYSEFGYGFGGGIYNAAVGFVVSNSTIADNKVASYGNGFGGGIYNTGGGFVVSNCALTGNGVASYNLLFLDVEAYGGGIYNRGVNFVISNCTLTNNTAIGLSHRTVAGNHEGHAYERVTGTGGGIHNTGDNFAALNCTLTNNTANSKGGGIYNTGLSFVLSNCNIANSTATGVSYDSFSNESYFGWYITDTTGYGGGICNIGDSFVATNCTIVNSTSGFGGGIYNTGSGSAVSNCTLANNTATGVSHALYHVPEYMPQRNSTLVTGAGGGIANYGGVGFVVSNCLITNNTAITGGGGIYQAVPARFDITNSSLINNQAPNGDGGAIWIDPANLSNLHIDTPNNPNQTVFVNNMASCATNRLPQDDTLYTANIFTDHWTTPYTQGYNNFDISYPQGTNISDVTVIFKIPSLDPNDTYKTQWTSTVDVKGRVVEPNPWNPSGTGGYPVNYVAPLWYSGYDETTNAFSGAPWDFNTNISQFSGPLLLYAFDNVAFDNPSAVRTINHGASLNPACAPFENILIKNNFTILQALTIASDRNLTYHSLSGSEVVLTTGGGYRHFDISGGEVGLTFADSNVVLSGQAVPSGGSDGGGIALTGPSTNLTLVNAIIQYSKAREGGAINVGNGCKLNLSNATLTQNSAGMYGGGIYNTGAGSTITNCTITYNNYAYVDAYSSVTRFGGGIYNTGSDFVVTNCTIANNNAIGMRGRGFGGGIYNTGKGFRVSHSVIINNRAAGDSFGSSGNFTGGGGGIYNSGDDFVVSNCTLTYNTATGSYTNFGISYRETSAGHGGGIYNSGVGFVISNCALTYNSAPEGGGIYDAGVGFVISNCTLTNNTANGANSYYNGPSSYPFASSGGYRSIGSGGGICNIGVGFEATSCILVNNTATEGGAIYNGGFGCVVSNCTLISNTANGDNSYGYQGGNYIGTGTVNRSSYNSIGSGGAIYNTGFGCVVSNCILINNTANSSGGGIANFGSASGISSCTLTYNTAKGNSYFEHHQYNYDGTVIINEGNYSIGSGGAIYNGGLGFVVSNCILTNNIANNGGGIYTCDIVLNEHSFISNNRAVNGSGIYFSGGSVELYSGTISNNVASDNGGGIWVDHANLNQLFVYDGVVFSNNSASVAYNRDPLHDAIYHAQIGSNVVWTTPFIQGYNNYDISYTNGSLIAFTVTYDANGGSGAGCMVNLGLSDLLYGNQHRVLSAEEANVGTVAGCVFVGWNTQPDGSGLIGGVQGNFIPKEHTFTAIDITLYAQWEKPDNTVYVKSELELQAAIDKSENNTATIIALNNDIELSKPLILPAQKNITLTSNSQTEFFKLIGPKGANTLTVETSGLLELAGINVTHNQAPGRGVTVRPNGTLILSSGAISGNTFSSTPDGSMLELGGGGVYNAGSFSMFNGVISNNCAVDAYGGGVYSGGAFSLFGGVISDNSANCGGGIVNSGNGSIAGGTIANNTALEYGCGIYNTGGNFTITNCTLTQNYMIVSNSGYPSRFGGGIYNVGDDCMVSNSFISSNGVTGVTGSGYGGGIYNTGTGCAISNCIITNNAAGCSGSSYGDGFGGGIYNAGVGFVVSNSTIANNNVQAVQGSGFGGGIYNGGLGFVVSNCVLTGNGVISYRFYALGAVACGGGIYNTGIDSGISNCIITRNAVTGRGYSRGGNHDITYSENATGVGGGIHNTGDNLTVSNCTIKNNIADHKGGGIYNGGLGFVVSNCAIANNAAIGFNQRGYTSTYYALYDGGGYTNATTGFGGGIYNGGDRFMVTDCTVVNNTSGFGGGIYNGGLGFVVSNCTLSHNTVTGISHVQYYYPESVQQYFHTRNGTFFTGSGGGIANFGGLGFVVSFCLITNNTAAVEGGAIYQAALSRLDITTSTFMHNQALKGDGGAIWLDTANLANLYIDTPDKPNQTLFANNRAPQATNRLPQDDEQYVTNIFTDHWTTPHIQGYNNFDISYPQGVGFSDLLIPSKSQV